MTEYSIRPAQRSDIRAITDLWLEMMAHHRERDPRFRFGPNAQRDLEQHLHATIRSRQALICVAVVGPHVVGYVLAELHSRRPTYPVGTYGFISDLCVTKCWRCRGIGRMLVERCMDWFQKKGVTAVELFVADMNPSSVEFWRKLGWTDYLRLMRLDTEPEPS